MQRSFKYRLYPSASQARELAAAIETHRRLYNECLGLRQLAWDQYKTSVNYFDCSRWLTGAKKTNEFYRRINARSAQLTLRRLDKAFQNFYRRVEAGQTPGYPRFKGREHFNSVEFSGSTNGRADGTKLVGNRLRIQHVGTIRVKLHREVEGRIKTVTIKRDAGKWFVIFSCDLGPVEIPKSTLPAVGIDVGLESFLTTSDGHHEPNPRYLKDALPALRVASRAVSRKKLGGSNRRKAVAAVRLVHARVKNLRREHAYKVAHKLVLAYGFIAVESLTIRNMVRNGRLSRAISDAAWGGFLNILKHKAEKAGAQVVEVNPSGTSQTCSGCHGHAPKNLREREHECPHCGLVLHRDLNAAINILAKARAVRTEPLGVNVDCSRVVRSPKSRLPLAVV